MCDWDDAWQNERLLPITRQLGSYQRPVNHVVCTVVTKYFCGRHVENK